MTRYSITAYNVQSTVTGATLEDAIEAFLLEITPDADTIEEAAVIAGWGEDVSEWIVDVKATASIREIAS
jgi:hypothetical protein